MILLYICDCCDKVVEEISFPDRPSGKPSGLTLQETGDIINAGEQTARYVLPALCDDCREMYYGGPDHTFISGPTLH